MDSEILEKAKALGYSNIVELLNDVMEYNDLVLICKNNIDIKTKLMEFLNVNGNGMVFISFLKQ